jgi:hypothetical protein
VWRKGVTSSTWRTEINIQREDMERSRWTINLVFRLSFKILILSKEEGSGKGP